ncbi:organic cation transporter protein-like [Pollicipes pollicipes]|uniref:organic cation transporter protein-like n=1 Tax=Pollicipes pollicipes TaxID=41117 RepID=UPI0018858314|nr:organic cation transporter protein-like [Pollicipes pollicipes]
MESTIVSEFDLVCDSEPLRPLGASLFFVGVAVGSILTGFIADRWGRVVTLMASVVLTATVGTAAAFAPSYGVYTGLRFAAAVFSCGFFNVPFVLCMELTSIDARAFCGIIINAFFAVGEALTGVFPIFVKDWKSLQLIYSVPIVLFCPYWFFLPESPRWLMAVGRKDKAEKVLRNVAKWNGKPFPEELVMKERSGGSLQEPQAINESFISVIKSPVLLKRAFILAFQWLVVAMVYYGIGMVSTDLGGDVYTNFILTMLIEIPSYVFCALTINPLGRKLVIGGAFLLSGLGTICAGLVPANELEWLTTTLALLGKFGAASAFSLLYLYTAELYPNGVRVIGVGVASASGRIGSVLAPVIADLGTAV